MRRCSACGHSALEGRVQVLHGGPGVLSGVNDFNITGDWDSCRLGQKLYVRSHQLSPEILQQSELSLEMPSWRAACLKSGGDGEKRGLSEGRQEEPGSPLREQLKLKHGSRG